MPIYIRVSLLAIDTQKLHSLDMNFSPVMNWPVKISKPNEGIKDVILGTLLRFFPVKDTAISSILPVPFRLKKM